MLKRIETFFESPLSQSVATVVIAFLVIWIAASLVRRAVTKRVEDSSSAYRLRKLVGGVAWALSFGVIAVQFSDQLGGLTVAFGVAGAGIAFALQEVIASVAGWFALQFGGFYRIGDRVQLGGIKGDVIDIGVLRTTLMEMGEWVAADQYSGRIVRIANSFVFKEPVFNYSGDFPFLWEDVTVPVRYGSDYDRMRAILLDVANRVVGEHVPEARKTWAHLVGKFAVEDASVEPMVTIVANDNWVQFSLRYVVNFKRRRVTKDQIMVAMLKEVDATKGAIQLASATFELTALPKIDIRMDAPAPAPRPAI